jgi:methyl-accepting chemotaxis protein
MPAPHTSNDRDRLGLVVAVLALTAVLAATAAGCGGSKSAEEKWADSVCTNLGNWKSQVKQSTDDIAAKLRSPQQGTLAAMKADVQKLVDATQELAQNLNALGAPKTDSGAQAKQQLATLASNLQTTTDKAKQTLATVPESAGLTETAQKLAPLAPDLQSLAAESKSTVQSIEASSSDLKKGFEQADSCKQFR